MENNVNLDTFKHIQAEIITHSKRKSTGEEIITYKLTFPRIILSEINTYGSLSSRNTGSNRAIPFQKLVETVKSNAFYPYAYQKSHSGMQGTEYFKEPQEVTNLNAIWGISKSNAVSMAEEMFEQGVSKQIINRMIESYTWTVQMITGTRQSFEHLFEQRCPIYNVEGLKFNSRKDAIELYPHLQDFTHMDWLECNSGQAEIHFSILAEKMYDVLKSSVPETINIGNEEEDEKNIKIWHIPFENEIIQQYKEENGGKEPTLDEIIVMSVARTARISYTKITDADGSDGTNPNYEKSLKIYNKCKKEGHYSVFTHIAKCMADYEYDSWIKGKCLLIGFSEFDNETFIELPTDKKGWNKNLKGFISLRQYMENGEEIKK